MLAPTAAILLDLWESARRRTPHERALQLLAWALPDRSLDELADLDLGLRDWHLLRLRQTLFGPVLSAYGRCPHCGERIELELDARALHAEAPAAEPPQHVDGAGRRYRLPTTRDLIAIARMGDPDAAAEALFAACSLDTVLSADIDMAAIERGLAALSVDRGVQLDLCCAACGGDWPLDLDPGAFCWEEIEAHAQALLDDIHRLASAYGWSEHDILALGNPRRAAYLDRIG